MNHKFDGLASFDLIQSQIAMIMLVPILIHFKWGKLTKLSNSICRNFTHKIRVKHAQLHCSRVQNPSSKIAVLHNILDLEITIAITQALN